MMIADGGLYDHARAVDELVCPVSKQSSTSPDLRISTQSWDEVVSG